MIYVVIGIGLIAACYGGYKYGYEAGVTDAFELLDDWKKIYEQIQNVFKDVDNNK